MAKTKRTVQPAMEFIIRPDGFETDIPDEVPPDALGSDLVDGFRQDRYEALYELGFRDPEEWFPTSLLYLHRVSSSFIRYVVNSEDIEELGTDRTINDSLDLMRIVGPPPFVPGAHLVNATWVRGMWERLLQVFRAQFALTGTSVDLYFTEKNQDLHVPGKIFFHLVEDKHGTHPFAFMATYSPENSRTHLPLRYALEEYRDDRERLIALLSNITDVAERSQFISSLMDTGEILHPIGFNIDEAYTFLREVPIYEECGIRCRIPNWWYGNRSNIGLGARIGDGSEGYIGMDTILSYRPELSLDGVTLTEEEILELTRGTEGLAKIKGKWVEVNQSRLKRTLDAYDRAKELMTSGITMGDALRMMFSGGHTQELGERVEVEFGEWMNEFLKRLSEPDTSDIVVPPEFKASLRPYQKTGVAWLTQLSRLGLGACLADDMGLGKTVQMLGYLSTRMTEGIRTILVVPPSLMGNWVSEAERFLPSLSVNTIHGDTREDDGSALTITTYGMLTRVGWLSKTDWDVVILDEAQAIKNPGTIQTRASKLLRGRFKVALTGTPVENGLWDLWSIFDYIIPGLLGDEPYFDRIVNDSGDRTYATLRNVTSPFILRRLKTDPGIADDLPDKNETKVYVNLSRKQAALYSKLADSLKDSLEHMDPKYRSAVILSSLTKFKQICNHPDQYIGSGDYLPRYSEKMQALQQICGTICERKERVLVFTQYKEMTEPLNECLSKVFGKEGLVIHGGVSPKQRSKMVERFNSGDNYIPYMVLSLKAGGVGLNLTAANHVIHFDRWWNPAIENQATDRAYRMGQSKEVTVYKLVSKGTIEEIDDMIESKTGIANAVISSGERWITQMSNEEIASLFTLR